MKTELSGHYFSLWHIFYGLLLAIIILLVSETTINEEQTAAKDTREKRLCLRDFQRAFQEHTRI